MAKPATVRSSSSRPPIRASWPMTKNPRNITEKFTFRKYDPVARKHVEFKEAKIK